MSTHYEDRCGVEACPDPNSEAWHRCFCCGRQPIEHHHVLRRSTHPDKKLDPYNLVALCPRHHQLVTEHKWSDLIYAHPNGEMHYNVKDENGQDKCDRAIGSWRDSDADRETTQGMRGESSQAGTEAQHGTDGALPQEVGDHDGQLHEVVGPTTTERFCEREPDLDGEGVGDTGLGEPRDYGRGCPPEIDRKATSQIVHTDEKWPVPQNPTLPTVEEHSTYLSLPEDATYGPTSLTLREGLSYERWQEIGETLQNMAGALPFWVGDWLNYGERTYGETYAQAVEATGMKTQTLLNYASVASRVQLPARVDSLSWSHHREVAALEPPEQVALLERAVAENLSTRELRLLVKTGCVGIDACQHQWRCDLCGITR